MSSNPHEPTHLITHPLTHSPTIDTCNPQAAADHGFAALEYLGSVVEFDALDYWDNR